ncbi:Acyl-coenzyme A oxidase (Acyl-CoA oxidase) [Durusdinium trenchii]|uniref:Acyl-coenzyme A oxidase (Acyl-CoA oxidase) n=1 Tax=Durusdinium trenchii TaxID=1381693 RepID=A0ABP0JR77_9DINO
MVDAEWKASYSEAIKDIHGDCHFEESAEMLRRLIRTKLLKFTDLKENPERFFEAHRLLLAPGRNSDREGSGFGVRFTVQFNLFAGSVLGLGGPEQVAELDTMQEKGTLGCFCLTEKFAGVNSGLVVHTTATWSPERQQFLIESPDRGSVKNWISQGLTASRAVVIANLCVNGKFYGPHGFLVDMRDESTGELKPGVVIEDMGIKTTANDLDNASVEFNKVWVDKSALLNRFADIQDDKYVQTTEEKMRIEIIGQRLLTGRLAIAEASVIFAQRIFEMAREYAENKPCWAPKGQPQPMLADMPQLATILAEADRKLSSLVQYNFAVEKRLNSILRENAIPDAAMVEAIAVAKIKSVQTAIDLTDRLRREVGSYALMASSGMQSVAWLSMCAFAEGDTRILMQKLARDSMKKFKASSWTDTGKEIVFGTSAEQQEMKFRFLLSRALSGAASAADSSRLWNENWELVYGLAEAVCDRYFAEFLGEEKVLSKL